jgi:hypothetical protein
MSTCMEVSLQAAPLPAKDGSITKRALRWCLAVAVSASLLGCASGVKREERADTAAIAQTAAVKYSALNLYLNDKAQKLIADNAKFNPEALKGTLQRMLVSRNLLAVDSPYRIDVEITDIRARSNFSAVMFGFLAGSDSVAGTVYLRDKDGKQLGKYDVSASYALGGIAGGQDETRMGWLYEEFARLAVNELTGEGRR